MENSNRTIVAIFEKFGQLERSLMWDVAKKENLSPIQMQILSYVHASRPELCKVSILALEFNLTKATVSDAVSSLVGKGLLRRIVEKHDRRSFILELSAGGRKVVTRVARWSEVLLEHLSAFPDADKASVLRFLMDLLKSLLEDGALNIARMCIVCDNFEENANSGAEKPHRCRLTKLDISDADLNMGCRYFTGVAAG